jgi:hypothetical protein
MNRTRITRDTLTHNARNAAAAPSPGGDAGDDEEREDTLEPMPEQAPGRDDGALQGEGDYTAARRHRESVKEFIDEGRVADAARQAEPESAEQAQELRDAEVEGRKHARR